LFLVLLAVPLGASAQNPVSVFDTSLTEGNAGSSQMTFNVTLVRTSCAGSCTINWATSAIAGGATANTDYTTSTGQLFFPPPFVACFNQTLQFSVPIIGDAASEPFENFNVTLSAPTGNCTLGDASGIGTINNDDVVFNVSDASSIEGTGAASAQVINFTVSLQNPTVTSPFVSYATSDGTAAGAGVDYTSASGSLQFSSTVSSITVRAPLIGDALDEANETFFLNLSGAQGGTIGDGQGLGTIIDDDAAPNASINNPRPVAERDTGTRIIGFNIQLDAASGQTVTLNWATADDTATAGLDYVAASGTVTFPPGTTNQPIDVTINSDVMDEDNERFFVNLSAGTNVTIADSQGFGTITDDDIEPTLSISDVLVTEGDSGTTLAVFSVSLSAASGRTVDLNWFANDATALNTSDYQDAEGGFSFPPGVTSQTLAVLVNGDEIFEGDETFTVDLGPPSNASLADGTGVATIIDDDPVPGITINDVTVSEGNSGGVTALFIVSLSNPSAGVVSVAYASANGSATSGSDYNSATGNLSFAAGVTAVTIRATVLGDTLDEANETFVINLSGAQGGTITDSQGQGTINDDDASPSISISDVTVTEGNAGNIVASFVATLSSASGQVITAAYATANNSAAAPGDYTSTSGTVTFPAGNAAQTIAVTVLGDTLDEALETFFVNLSNATGGATIADPQGIGTITDDDAAPSISVADVTVTEGNSGTTNLTFVAALSGASGQTISINYASSNGTATAPGDYTGASGTLSFAPGSTSQAITIAVAGDTFDEANETLNFTLTAPVNVTIADGAALGTITDDDAAPAMSISDVVVTEGNSGTTIAQFTVTLSAASGQTITANYTTAAGTALAGTDYTTAGGTLTFAAGVTTQTINVTVLGDVLDESNETFFADLSAGTNVTIADTRGQATITDDDGAPAISVNDVVVTEGNSGTATAQFSATLSAASGQAISVAYASANGTALAPGDYTAGSGTLNFAAGVLTQTFNITIAGDTFDEGTNETFVINLSNPTGGATISDAQGLGTITDDDAAPSVSINDVTVTEGNGGTTPATFSVTLSAASGQTISVDYASANGTATTPGDFAGASGTLTFLPGTTTQTVLINVNGDTLDEGASETYTVVLSNALNVTIADGSGAGTITDDDGAPVLSINDVSAVEGNSGTVTFTFTVSLSAASGLSIGVDWASSNGTAIAPGDYAAGGARLTFAPGTTTQTFGVTVNGDTLNEVSESFNITLSNASNAAIADNTGSGTIIDDDAAPSLFISDLTITEGNAGTAVATFTAQLTAASGQAVTVDWATANSSAVAPGDYAAGSGTLSFAAGATSRTFTVAINGDTLDEANETFLVNLSNATNAPIVDAQAIGTITDDDGAPAISIADVTVTEGNAGTANAVFAATLSAASGQTITVTWTTANGTGSSGADYVAASGTLTFAAGVTTQNVTVVVNGDTLDEADETFTVTLSTPVNVTIADDAGLGTITDDDVTPVLSISDANITEGNAGNTTATFTVTLSTASGRTISLDFATANGTALAGSDYTAAAGNLSFTPGSTSRTISVAVLGDTVDEANETFVVDLSNGTNVTIADTQGMGTISDDDGAPAISINDVTVTEGNAGTVNAVFVATLSAASGLSVSTDYATANGTATSGSDYTAGSGTLVFGPGVLTQSITVVVSADTVDELNETFFVNLTNPANATLLDGQGLGTITDDDTAPVLSINDVTVTEGNAGTVNASYTVTLSAASGQTVTVDYASAGGSATSGTDFVAASGTLSFTAGQLTRTLTVVVNSDVLDETNEAYSVVLSNPTNATIADATGAGTITDDDTAPNASIADLSISEGNSGTSNAVFTVSLSAASGQAITLAYATVNGTALAPADYTAGGGTLTFAAGSLSQTITVPVAGDTLDETNETFSVELSTPVNVTIADGAALATITDDDAAPSLSITDSALTEGNTGSANLTFTVTLSAASGQTINVDYAGANGTAVSPADYAAASGTLSFGPGVLTQTFVVAIAGDVLDEADETFTVTLSNPVNAAIGDGVATGIINDNDGAPSISIADATVTEPAAGTASMSFTVTLSAASGQTISVAYATSDATAVAGADYTPASGTLTFPAGTTSLTISATVLGDVLDEANETFTVTLTTPVNATLADATGAGTITDNDAPPSVSIADASLNEGSGGTTTLTLVVTLSAASGQTISVDYASSNGTATAPADYTAANGILSFAPGVLSQSINLTIAGDTIDETNETITVTLSNGTNVTLTDATGIATITDDDAAPALSIADVTVTETNAGTLAATFTVTLSAASGQTVTVDYATANDSAVAPADFVATNGTLTLLAGVLSQTFTVTINGDTFDEANETYLVNLTNPVNAVLGDGQAIGTITDNDAAPTISIADTSITEGGTINFTVTLSAASGQTITVAYGSADATATSPSDYPSTGGVLTFGPGVLTQSIAILTVPDTLDEPDETLSMGIFSATNATVLDNNAIATITDDDAAPSASIDDLTVAEGTAATSSLIFNVTLSAPSAQTITLIYATANGTAVAPGDYTAAGGTLTFAPGAISQPITVVVQGDALDEAAETLTVTLSAPVNVTIADANGTGTITDDDAAPSLSIADQTITEGNAGTAVATFTVTLSAASGQTVSVAYATSNATAVAPGDYTAANGTLSFAAGVTTQTFTVSVIGDAIDEANETFTVTLSAPVNATLADATGTGSITDDDGAPQLSIADITVTEGNAGSSLATFTVTLLPSSGQAVTVNWATADGTARAGLDYTAASGALSFAIGATTQTFTVSVSGDTLDEADESFVVSLSQAVNATINDAQATALIADNDAAPTLSIADATIAEGNAGTAALDFTLTLSAASAQAITVDYSTANITAIAPADYTAASGSVTFAPGVVTRLISVNIAGDVLNEATEGFAVNLSNGVNVTLADGQATGTITNDDAQPSLSVADVTTTEGNTGTTNAVYTVTLSAASGQTVTVNYTTADGTATAPADYLAQNGTLSFGPGVLSQVLNVPVQGDGTDEPNETYALTLSAAVNATLGDGTAAGTITDDDAGPVLSITSVTVTEGAGSVTATFNVDLAAPSGQTVTVQYATANGTATAPADYTAASGALTFTAGVTTRSINVTVLADLLDEPNETFTVVLSNPANATIGTGTGSGTINDDDAPAAISIADATIAEGNAGTSNLTFTVSLSAASGQTISVNYATADQSATAGDYGARSGILTFGPGVLTQTFTVPVTGDLLDEPDEQFVVNLSAPVNASISDNQAVASITDDDNAPSLSIADVSVTEPNAGTTGLTFTVTLSAASGQTVSVNYATTDQSASGTDYVARSGTLSFGPGVLTQTVVVTINGDVLDEPNETFAVNLSNAVNAAITDAQAIGTITDNDGAPSLNVANTSLAEGDSGSVTATFEVTLASSSGQTISVSYATADLSATGGVDYLSASGTLTFAPGTTVQNVQITVNADLLDEADESFELVLSAPVNATLGDPSGNATILDDDDAPSIFISKLFVGEPTGAPADAIFTVTLSAPSGQAISIDYATIDESALAGQDYQLVTDTLIFLPGEIEQEILVLIEGDTLDESDETFVLALSNAINATTAVDRARATITDDDAAPALSIADVSVIEGNGGTNAVNVLLSLSAPSGLEVRVDASTVDGTALAVEDYAALSETLVFAPGELEKTVALEIAAAALPEPEESFFVELSNAVNATIARVRAEVSISDDDIPPDLALVMLPSADFTVGEEATYTVSLSNIGIGPTIGPIVLTDRFPEGLSFVASEGEDWTCTDDQGLLTCTSTAVVEAGEALGELVLTVNLGPEAFPSVTNTATVSTAAELVFSNNTAAASSEVTGAADLVIIKSREVAAAPLPGQEISWLLTVTNLGPNAVSELFVVDQMPAAVSEVRFSLNGEGDYDVSTGLISGRALEMNETVELVVTGLLAQTATGALTNRAFVSVPVRFIDPNAANDNAVHVSMISGEGDCDGDGLTDEVERMRGTEPCVADTDGDGLPDGIEILGMNPTDPLNPDSDGDGLCDGPLDVEGKCVGGEDTNMNGMMDPDETDPNDEDTDDGGVNDLEERERGTNPRESADDQERGCDCQVSERTGATSPSWLLFAVFAAVLLSRKFSRHRA
jgi:hypothetical protein